MRKTNQGHLDNGVFLFNAILEQAGVRELDMNGRQFIWGNNMHNPTFEKLDRILCSTEWDGTYPLTQVTALTREKSDHTPLYLDSGDFQKTEPIFMFENAWFMRDGIDELYRKSGMILPSRGAA